MVVEDQHQSSTNAADNIGQETLVETLRQALLRRDLLEAIARALVQVLLDGLLGLHLQATTDGVEWVGRASTDGNGRLGSAKGGQGTHDSPVLLVRVQSRNGVEGSQLQATITDDANHGHAEASIQEGQGNHGCP